LRTLRPIDRPCERSRLVQLRSLVTQIGLIAMHGKRRFHLHARTCALLRMLGQADQIASNADWSSGSSRQAAICRSMTSYKPTGTSDGRHADRGEPVGNALSVLKTRMRK
jgi:hypothetical protein